MVREKDYICAPTDDRLPENLDEMAHAILLSPTMAEEVACATPTIRGRKLMACLFNPGVKPSDLTEQHPALLEVLFVPPSRGVASL
jgi:hypothetical protein